MRGRYSYRRSAVLLGALFAIASLGLGQDEPPTPPPTQQPARVVKVLRVQEGDGVAENVAALIRSFQVDVRTSQLLGLITVAGQPDEVAKAEQAIHEIEQLTPAPSASTAQDVEITAHLLGIVDEDTNPPPGPLRDIVAELKKTFAFRGYKLLETIVLRTRVGEHSQIAGLLPEASTEQGPPKRYDFQCRVVQIEPRQNSQLVHFGYVRVKIRLPITTGQNLSFEDVQINTGLEVLDGKTVVVGKAGATGTSQGYLLVLTARVVK